MFQLLILLVIAFPIDLRDLTGLYQALSFIGLGAVLIGIGVLMVHARKLISRFDEQGIVAARWLPMLSSIFVTCLGIANSLIAVRVFRVHFPSFRESRFRRPSQGQMGKPQVFDEVQRWIYPAAPVNPTKR